MRHKAWCAVAAVVVLGLLVVGVAGAAGTIQTNGQRAFCKGIEISPQNGEFVINDESCVVNFFIAGGTWTSATLESSNDGGASWLPRNGLTFPFSTTTAGVATAFCNPAFGLGIWMFRAHGVDSTGADVYSNPYPYNVHVQACNDTTPPNIFSGPTLTPNPVTAGTTATLTWLAGDSNGAPTGEYWVDTDPGVGQANAVPNAPNFQGGGSFTAPLSGLTLGTHTIGVRAEDPSGNWSPTATTTLTVVEGGSTTQTISGGGTVTTDPSGSGATTDVPVQTTLTLPADAGTQTVSITAQTTSDPAPSGFNFFGNQVVIDNGGATTAASSPYVLTFTIDSSLLGGIAPSDIQVFRDGVAIAQCTDPTAAIPDGVCIAGTPTATADGDGVVTIRTTHFSKWNFGKPAYAFGGFYQPVDNAPVVNTTKAGSGIPVKFSLGGNRGLNVFSSGYPTQAVYACQTGVATDAIESTVNAGSSSLSFDATANTYTYVWKTEKGWASSCRELTLRFRDGTIKKARFQFTK